MIYTRPRYERAWRKLTLSQQAAVNGAVAQLEARSADHTNAPASACAFGRYFEFSAGLGLRILFLNDGGDLFLCFAGNHDQVRAFIKQAS